MQLLEEKYQKTRVWLLNATSWCCLSAIPSHDCQWWGATILFPAMPVWKALTEAKCKFFAWIAMQDRVLTADNLLRRSWPCNYYCSLCLCLHETTEHLLTGCNFTEAVWNVIASKFQLPSFNDLSSSRGPVGWVTCLLNSGTKKEKRKKPRILFTVWWQIWKQCNRRIIQDKHLSFQAVATIIIDDLYLQLQGFQAEP
jgi:hypothetical protein